MCKCANCAADRSRSPHVKKSRKKDSKKANSVIVLPATPVPPCPPKGSCPKNPTAIGLRLFTPVTPEPVPLRTFVNGVPRVCGTDLFGAQEDVYDRQSSTAVLPAASQQWAPQVPSLASVEALS